MGGCYKMEAGILKISYILNLRKMRIKTFRQECTELSESGFEGISTLYISLNLSYKDFKFNFIFKLFKIKFNNN